MLTFIQYLEGMNVFNTRDAAFETPLAADRAEDHNDSTYFLAPLARKIKALGYYCISAHRDFLEPLGLMEPEEVDSYQRNRSGRLPERAGSLARNARITGVRSFISNRPTDDELYPEGVARLSTQLEEIYYQCKEFVDNYQRYADYKETIRLDILKNTLTHIASDVEWIISWQPSQPLPDRLSEVVERIRDRMTRVARFLREAESQMDRMINMKPPKRLKAGFSGRWVDYF